MISFISLLMPSASLGKNTFISSVSTTCLSCSLYRCAMSCVCLMSASNASIFLVISAELFAPSFAASYSSCIEVRYLYILSCSSIFLFCSSIILLRCSQRPLYSSASFCASSRLDAYSCCKCSAAFFNRMYLLKPITFCILSLIIWANTFSFSNSLDCMASNKKYCDNS